MMGKTVGAAPVIIDVDLECSTPGGPIGGQTKINMRNKHFEYIVTWYSLCAFLCYLAAKRFLPRISPKIAGREPEVW